MAMDKSWNYLFVLFSISIFHNLSCFFVLYTPIYTHNRTPFIPLITRAVFVYDMLILFHRRVCIYLLRKKYREKLKNMKDDLKSKLEL